MLEILNKYGYRPDSETIDRNIEKIARNLENALDENVLKDCFSMMDLTTLKPNDTEASVKKLVSKVNDFEKDYPSYPIPASVCVYSNFAKTIVETRNNPELHATVVSACFPTSQSFLEVKLKECEMAVQAGADEVDIVLALNAFLAGEYDRAAEEIRRVREVIDAEASKLGRKVILKVILETGLLVNPDAIAAASFLAMEAGADFIKTSTGKVDVNATPMAAYVMCECIKVYHEKTGKKIGFKPAGGMTAAMDTVSYYSIVANVLGKEWLNKDLLRFGVSRVANSILSTIEQKTVAYF